MESAKLASTALDLDETKTMILAMVKRMLTVQLAEVAKL